MRGYDQVWIRRIEFSPGRVTTLSDACVLFKNAKPEATTLSDACVLFKNAKPETRRRQTKLTTHLSKRPSFFPTHPPLKMPYDIYPEEKDVLVAG